MTERPLAGVTVLDFSRTMAGPFATMLLADLGATIIKVEGPGGLGEDTTRSSPPKFDWLSMAYLTLNRSKMSIAIDLGAPEAASIVDRLAARSDVVIENMRLRSAEQFNLTWDRFKAVNPRIVHCRISGFGMTGTERDTAAYDLTIQAATGALDITGERDRPPAKLGVPVVDLQTGVAAAVALLAALEKRERDGVGASIDISMFDLAINMLGYMGLSYLNLGMIPGRLGSGHQTIYPYNAFETEDHRYIVVAPFTNRFWRSFCEVIGRGDLPENPEYHDFASRLANRSDLAPLLDAIMRERTATEWLELFRAAHVPAGPVNLVSEALESAQTAARGMTPEIDIPPLGTCRILGSPFRFRSVDGEEVPMSYGPPPRLGADTRQVLETIAGYTPEEVTELGRRGVVGFDHDDEGGTARVGRRGEERPTRASDPGGPGDLPAAGAPPKRDGARRRPLDGLRVLDFTRMAAGPFATLMLADLGADVVKVEAGRIGDPTRRNLPIVGGTSVYFLSLNRGKRSIVLDLKTDGGRERALDLARHADLVVENFRPGVMARLGLDFSALAAVNRRLVMCSISGFGATGPMRDFTSFDLVNQAYAGYMAVTGEEGRPPVRLGWPVGDLGGGAMACVAMLAALHRVRQTGLGFHVDLSLHDCLLSQLAYLGQTYLMSGEEPRRVGAAHLNIAPYNVYEARDGYVAISAYTEAAWRQMVEVLEAGHLLADPRFETRPLRRQHRHALDAVLAPYFRAKSVAECDQLFASSGVAYAPVADVGQALESAKTMGRGLVVDTVTESGDPALGVASPFVIDGERMVAAAGPPGLGQHDDAKPWMADA
jgi:crotonobetainyl-CoA:carnitine CoA-transferase CaiB-like acyl-CoA transferase